MMIWADHIQKSVFRHSGTLWLPRRFSAIICFLLRARFKKIISNIYHDSKIYNRIAFGTSFSYLKAFPSPSPGCPGMTNQLFSKHYQGVLPSKSVTGDWLFGMLFLRHYYDQNKLKRVDIYHHIEYASASKKKVDHFFEVLAKLYQFTISAFLTIYDS